mgnify:CR=1 FL=1
MDYNSSEFDEKDWEETHNRKKVCTCEDDPNFCETHNEFI